MIYQITENIPHWLYPAIAIVGIFFQLLALFLNCRPILLSGLILTLAGAIGDRDLSLGIGALLASGGVWFLKKR